MVERALSGQALVQAPSPTVSAASGFDPSRTETGWLIEMVSGPYTHWVALAQGAWPRTTASTHPYRSDRYKSPIRSVKDASEAIRFARKQDAEAFIELFDWFLLDPVATEHEWPAIAIEAATAGETGTGSTQGESAGPKDIAQGGAA